MAVENGSRTRKLEARYNRDSRISTITQALHDGFGREAQDGRNWATADYGGD
jgi:beta-lactamase class A